MVSSTRVFIEFCCVALLAYWPVMAFSTKRTIDTEEQLQRALECADARSRARRRNGVPAP